MSTAPLSEISPPWSLVHDLSSNALAKLRTLRFGYTSFSRDHRHPADRRRFPHVASVLGLSFEEARRGGDYDVVVITQAADITAWNRLPAGGPRLIYDLVDSHLNTGLFNGHRELLRGVGKYVVGQSSALVLNYRRAMAEMCRRADTVVCSTPEQAAVIRQYNERVRPILDFTSVAATQRKTNYAAGSAFRIAWEGLVANAGTLGVIAEPLRALARDRKIEVHLITDLDYPTMLQHYGKRSAVRDVRRLLGPVPTFFHEWSEFTLGTVATACDIAVLPLPSSNQLYWHKAENRLLLFWRMAVPTIVTGTPAHQRTMKHAGQDNHCSTPDEWMKKLFALAADEDRRRQAGEGGHRWVNATFSDEQLLASWQSTLLDTVGAERR